MKYYIYRNHTIEHLFKKLEAQFSGYDDISIDPKLSDIENIIWFHQFKPFVNYEDFGQELSGIKEKINFLFDNDNYHKNTIIIIPELKLTSNLVGASNYRNDYLAFINYIVDLSQKKSNIKYIFLEEFSNLFSIDDWIDWKYYYISDMIINPKLSIIFFNWFETKLRSINFDRKKCLILDCDNTLWGGVVGEDGINGLALGNTYPGKSFIDFQKAIVNLYFQGVIVALCSKNNEEDVWDVFDNNSNMVLKKEHIIAHKINWENKAQNIVELSKNLNIGLDSFVFIDDNPLEREIVKNYLPEVTVPEFPEAPFLLLPFITKLSNTYFSTFRLTEEDKQKSSQYSKLFKLNSTKKSFENHYDYLIDLEMGLVISKLNSNNISRIAQMTQKTNQFNLTTRRYNESDLASFDKNNNLITCLRLNDKYGEHGITASCVILFLDAHTASIDTFLLSCRILGRGIEHVYLKVILNYLYDKGIRKVFANYIPSKKNMQTELFFDANNFELVSVNPNGERIYVFSINQKINIDKHYKIEYDDK